MRAIRVGCYSILALRCIPIRKLHFVFRENQVEADLLIFAVRWILGRYFHHRMWSLHSRSHGQLCQSFSVV